MKIKFETFALLALLFVFTATMIGAAVDIHELEKTNARNSQLYVEVLKKLNTEKTYKTFSWVSCAGDETSGESETPKDFPTVESYHPEQDDDPTDPYRPGADDERSNQSNGDKEVQTAERDSALAGSDEHRSSIPLEQNEMWKPELVKAMGVRR